jgi:hypothetical protein
MTEIANVTVNEFLLHNDRYDTIILHILSGEGEDHNSIRRAIRSALQRCIKLVILEHNPESTDFTGLPEVNWMASELYPNRVMSENWGRNLLMTCSTVAPLQIPQLNDRWYEENIKKAFVSKTDPGIDRDKLIYTHTSESRIDFDLPVGTIYWVAGGGLCLEAMRPANVNIIIDPIFKQCLYTAHRVGVEPWKLERMDAGITAMQPPEYLPDNGNPRHWRRVTWNGVMPDAIMVGSVQELQGQTVYVSTVFRSQWAHLVGKCNIIDSFTDRDKPKLITV